VASGRVLEVRSLPVAPSVPAGEWQDLTATAGTAPLARQAYGMAYDPILGESVLFGGGDTDSDSLGDTWTFAGGVWDNITSQLSVSPSPRSAPTLVYDPTLQALVLYGGYNPLTHVATNDTWEFNASGWTELHPSKSPPLYTTFGTVYDSTDGYIFLWALNVTPGGHQAYWKFQDNTWTNLTATITGNLPSGRIYAADDPQASSVLFYGGFQTCPGGYGVTYTYAGGVFDNLTSTETTAPPATAGSSAMIYDVAAEGVVLFSGYSATCAITNQTWVFHSGDWVNLTSAVGPSPPGRWGAALAYDSTTESAVTFGGNENPVGGVNLFGQDTWEYVPAVHANATASVTAGVVPLAVSFTASPTGGTAPYRFNWSFDDGTPNSTVADVTHTFQVAGNYTVTLVVEDSVGHFAGAVFIIEAGTTGTLDFTQSGLPGGTEWAVSVDSMVWGSGTGGVANTLPPGSYSYTIDAVAGYIPTPSSGMATVVSSEITFVTVTFTPTAGWIAGTVSPTSATVRVDGGVVPTSSGAFNVSVAGGTTHSVEVTAPGYATYYNNVTVVGGKTTHLAIVASALTPAAPTFTSTDLYAIVGAILVLAVAILIGAALVRSRKGRQPPAQQWSSPPSPSPPPSGSPPSGP
jgi:PKD repeat protein